MIDLGNLLRQSLQAHMDYVGQRIYNKQKKIDFYNTMWYYIENTHEFKELPVNFAMTSGSYLALDVYECVYNSLERRFL